MKNTRTPVRYPQRAVSRSRGISTVVQSEKVSSSPERCPVLIVHPAPGGVFNKPER